MDARAILRDTFIISVLLILVVYWVGSTHLLDALLTKPVPLLYAATGRDSSGAFQNYPSGGQ